MPGSRLQEKKVCVADAALVTCDETSESWTEVSTGHVHLWHLRVSTGRGARVPEGHDGS